MKPEEYAALYKLDMLYGEKLPSIAMEWIETGYDSDALIELAWESFPTLGDAAPLFEQGLKDIGVEIPLKERALVLLGNIYCKQILSGELSPYEGANTIWNNVCNQAESANYFSEFVTLADAILHHSNPEIVERYNARVIDESKKVIELVNV